MAAIITPIAPALAQSAAPPPAAGPPAPGAAPASGLPVPRYASLKTDRVNLRTGPGTEYPAQWVFRRAGLPVEVMKEFEGWRQVRDAEGVTGWVLQSLISGRRTGLVLPKAGAASRDGSKPGAASPAPAATAALRVSDSDRARTVAMVESGVIANIASCDGRWCYVSIDDLKGYIEQSVLWGVYPGETMR